MLNFELIKTRAKSLAPLGVYSFLGLRDIRKIPIFVPHVDEQKKIASFLNKFDSKNLELKTRKEYYEKVRKGLIQKVLTGEIRVKV